MTIQEMSEQCGKIITAVSTVVVGKDEALSHVLAGILADGHILIEDYPGLAKTLIAHSFSQVLDIGFSRIQFTPDLLPGDITGSFIYNQKDQQFQFSAGPIFSNLILADEINRAAPKTHC